MRTTSTETLKSPIANLYKQQRKLKSEGPLWAFLFIPQSLALNVKKYYFLYLIFLLIFLGSCNEEEEKGYHFIDQDIQGTINGKPFFEVKASFSQVADDIGKFSVTMDSESTEDCPRSWPTKPSASFILPKKTGLYQLKFDPSDFENSYVVILFDPDELLNIRAETGAFEIISISETELVGRVDVRVDGEKESNINGNFIAVFCE